MIEHQALRDRSGADAVGEYGEFVLDASGGDGAVGFLER